MEFCPRCGRKLVLRRGKQGANPALRLRCPRCGYVKAGSAASQSLMGVRSSGPRDVIVVIDGEAEELRTMPTTRVDCPRCHNNVAYFWQVQTRSGDEGSTQFFRCTACGHTWRLYT